MNHELNTSDESLEIQYLLGNPLGWMSKWGIYCIFIFTLLFISLGWLIQYPDILTSRVFIVSDIPPVKMIAKKGGKVAALLVEDNAIVSKDQLLLVIENPANYDDVLYLDKLISDLKYKREIGHNFSFPNLRLGELQDYYSKIQEDFMTYLFIKNQNSPFSKIDLQKNQINQIKQVNESLKRQKKLLEQETKIAYINYQRNQNLFETKTVSVYDVEQNKKDYLKNSRELEMLEEQIHNNTASLQQIEITSCETSSA